MSGSSREGIFGIHPDILKNHILTRLDGASLAAVDCSSWELHKLASDDQLWKNICTSTWPSSGDPRVSRVISMFPGGYRSFFANCRIPVHHHCLWSRSIGFNHNNNRPSDLGTTSEMGLIVTFDVYYEDIHFLSYIMEEHDWFEDWEPFDDLEDPEEIEENNDDDEEDDTWIKELQQNLMLSCVVIDPDKKQAMTVSMRQRAVFAQRQGLTDNVHLKFATVMARNSKRGRWGGTKKELVELEMVVTNGRHQVMDVFLRMKDIEGRYICASDIVVILKRAIQEWDEIRKSVASSTCSISTNTTAYEGRQRFKDFLVEKRKWKASKNKFKLFFGAIMCL